MNHYTNWDSYEVIEFLFIILLAWWNFCFTYEIGKCNCFCNWWSGMELTRVYSRAWVAKKKWNWITERERRIHWPGPGRGRVFLAGFIWMHVSWLPNTIMWKQNSWLPLSQYKLNLLSCFVFSIQISNYNYVVAYMYSYLLDKADAILLLNWILIFHA